MRHPLSKRLFDLALTAPARLVRLRGEPGTAQRMSSEVWRIAAGRFDERLVFAKVKEEYARLRRAKGLPLPTPRTTEKEELLQCIA